MTPQDFIAKWQNNPLNERQASHSHFRDLCDLLEEPKPYDIGTNPDEYCFEKGATKTTGGEGWADVWKRGAFGWEYKGPRKDLTAAYAQLQQYAVALENPPLLVVCDRERFRVHTNFTNTVSKVHEIKIEELVDPTKRALLKAVFSDPDSLKPGKTRQALTVEVAKEFATLAEDLRQRGHTAEEAAHFINRLVFCMFAEDVKLLPNDMFKRMLEQAEVNPSEFKDLATDLFAAMRKGGRIGFEKVDWFNGGLFDSDSALPLEPQDIRLVLRVAREDWSDIDPSILGTLFERGLDPSKRSQLGAHYTDRDKIMQIVNAVLVRPLMAEWEVQRGLIAGAMESVVEARERRPSKQSEARKVHATARRAEERAWREAQRLHGAFIERLRNVRVLDPACGSGNFLYLALLALKDIEHRVNLDAEALGLVRMNPSVGPECLKGIELNQYAAELARVTVWIGEIQWMRRNGFDVGRNPILRPLDVIERRDAVLNEDGSEASWPPAEFIIGNPPFLGAKLMKRRLDQSNPGYTDRLRKAYAGRLAAFTDLVCYWFEKARTEVVAGRTKRVGLVSTSSIRGGTNRPVLDAISSSLVIHDAWAEQPWTIDGARVEVSLICFSDPDHAPVLRHLDGETVTHINPDLTSGIDVTKARKLSENRKASLIGIQLSGPHDVPGKLAREWMAKPTNPNGKANAEILKPYWNGDDLTGRSRDRWVIDIPLDLSDTQASAFEAPYEHLKKADYVPERGKPPVNFVNYRTTTGGQNPSWWEPHRPRPEMRSRIMALPRYIVTPETAEHRVFAWLRYPVLPDKNLIVIARDDDTTFGILHSRFHEIWALRLGTSLEDRPRYTSTTTFATFPFPDGMTPDLSWTDFSPRDIAEEIANAARSLVKLRDNWLNPPELAKLVKEIVPGLPDRYVPVSTEAATELRSRTLTDLYNLRPSWLSNAHEALDVAVAKAYGIDPKISEDDLLAFLLNINLSRSSTT